MRVAIIIPAYNEASLIKKTLDSLTAQTLLPKSLIVVDDNSTDDTAAVAASYPQVRVVTSISQPKNVPGAKVVKAFHQGLKQLDINTVDIICKFDADLIFPPDYLEVLVSRFRESESTGMVAGHCTVLKNNQWTLENQNNPDHIRGALKAYRVACFQQIGGLKESIGWDTMDEMLARFYGWKVETVAGLHVKHLKPTGFAYHSRSKMLQGEAFYKMRYGWMLTFITAAKMAWNKKSVGLFADYIKGYVKASTSHVEPLVNKDQGRFIRNYRWKGIRGKLGLYFIMKYN